MIIPDATRTQHILTPRRYALMQYVGAYTRGSVQAQEIEEYVWDKLCMRLTASILTDTQVSETQEVEFWVPATWWQHFKQGTWLGNKIARYRPVRKRVMTRRVTFERIRGYPMADVAPPERFGTPVVYDTIDWGPQIANT